MSFITSRAIRREKSARAARAKSLHSRRCHTQPELPRGDRAQEVSVNVKRATHSSIAIGIVLVASLISNSNSNAQTASTLTCNPSVISGGSGDSATCTITLSAAAPASGTVVTLTSSLIELAATVPTITVPAGQSTGTFV